MAQGGDRAFRGPGLAPRRPRPRPGHRGGVRQAHRGGAGSAISPTRTGTAVGPAWNTRAATAADGSFQFGVMPAPGYLTVLGPGEDYVLREIGQQHGPRGSAGRARMYAHAFHALDLKPGGASQDVAIALRPSAAVKGRVVGPDGQPVRDALVISRVVLQPTWIAWLVLVGRLPRRGAGWALRGARPARRRRGPRLFPGCQAQPRGDRDALGRSAAGGPVTVRLQPCGAARAGWSTPPASRSPIARRLRLSHDHDGRHPGPHPSSQDKADQDRLAADQDFVARFDPIHYQKGLVSDAQGTARPPRADPRRDVPHLRQHDRRGASPRLRKEFTVKPGEMLDLGDILIEKPPA